MLRKKAIYETELLSKNEIENFVRILYTEYNSAYMAKTTVSTLPSVLSKLRQFTSHYFGFHVFIKQRYTRVSKRIS